MSFAAIVAIDDDAPGSLLPLLLPLLLHALVVVVLLKLVLRALLVLALRSERRSCKSAERLILFPPNKPTKSGGKQGEIVVF